MEESSSAIVPVTVKTPTNKKIIISAMLANMWAELLMVVLELLLMF